MERICNFFINHTNKGGFGMNQQKLAKDILSLVGGEENVGSVTHCYTRLRFNLKKTMI